jgi:hypothetical protein
MSLEAGKFPSCNGSWTKPVIFAPTGPGINTLAYSDGRGPETSSSIRENSETGEDKSMRGDEASVNNVLESAYVLDVSCDFTSGPACEETRLKRLSGAKPPPHQ